MLLRFVRSPEGEVIADLSEKLPGRGAWVASRRDCIEHATAKGLFARAFKAGVARPLPSDAARFSGEVAEAIRARALNALGMARRAGVAAAGFEKVRDCAAAGRAAVLLIAADAGESGVQKLRRAAGRAALIRAFSAEEQSAALGLQNAVHVALLRSAHAERFLREARRLAGFLDDGSVTLSCRLSE